MPDRPTSEEIAAYINEWDAGTISEPALLDDHLAPEPDPDNDALRSEVEVLRSRVAERDVELEEYEHRLVEERDRRDLQDFATDIAAQSGVDTHRVLWEMLRLQAEDPSLEAAFQSRDDDPVGWEIARDRIREELTPDHRGDPRKQLAASVRMSREVSASSGGDYGDEWDRRLKSGHTSYQEYRQMAESVFSDTKAGKLRPDSVRHIGGKVA